MLLYNVFNLKYFLLILTPFRCCLLEKKTLLISSSLFKIFNYLSNKLYSIYSTMEEFQLVKAVL